MNAKDALFEEMGWTEDAGIRDWLGKAAAGAKSFFGGKKASGGGGASGLTMTMAEHAQVCEAQTPQRCKYARAAAEELAKKPENKGKSKDELLNEVWQQHQELKDAGQQEEDAEKRADELKEPEKADVGGVDLTLDTETQKAAVMAFEKMLADPSTTDEQKAQIQSVLENLKQNLEQVDTAPATEEESPGAGEEGGETPEQTMEEPGTYEVEMESELLEPMSDEDYAIASESDAIKDFKAQLNDFLDQGGTERRHEIDVSQWDPSSAYARAVNEVLAERQAGGQKVEEEVDKLDEIDFSDAEEAPAGEEAGGNEAAEADRQEQQRQSLNIIGKRDWTPQQRAALQEMAKRFGAAMEGIRQDVKDPAFARLLNDINHFKAVQGRWDATPNVSESRSGVREAIKPTMESHVEDDAEARLLDTIHGLIQQDELVDAATSDALKIALGRVAGILGDPDATDKEKDKAIRDYQTLCKKYNLSQYINGNGNQKGKAVDGYVPDGDENHRTGGVVSSEGKSDNKLVIQAGAEGDKITKGQYDQAQAAIDKIKADLEAMGIDTEGIALKNGVNTSEITIDLPPDQTESDANRLMATIMKKFPGLKLTKVKDGDVEKTIPANIFPSFDPYNSKITITLHNDKQGAVPQAMVVNHPKFQKAIADGKLVTSFAVDENGEPIMVDFRENPHMLFAGTSGAGKNARQDAAITALMAGYSPKDVQFIFVDGKGGGASYGKYKGSGYDLLPIAGRGEAVNRVNYLINEMQNRDQLFKKLGVEDLKGYNDKMAELVAAGQAPEGLPTHLPDIFLSIDEFGNVRNTIGANKFDALVNQIAQQGRSSGCHLMLATQNPTDKGGLSQTIKTNMSTIVGMTTTNSIGSRSIIDETGLERLRKKGPLAIKTSDGIVYADGSYIDPKDVKSSVDALPPQEEANTEPAEPKPTPEEVIDSLAKTPGMKNGLINIAERIATGDMRAFKVPAGEALEATKKYLESQGIPFEEKPFGDSGQVVITPKEPSSSEPSSGGGAAPDTSAGNGGGGGGGGGTNNASGSVSGGATSETSSDAPATTVKSEPSDESGGGSTGTSEGSGDATSSVSRGSESSSASDGSNPFLNEEELQGVGNDLLQGELRHEARSLLDASTKLRDLYKRADAGEKVSSREIDQARANYVAQYGRYNQARENAGLAQYDMRTNQPMQTESPTEPAGEDGKATGAESVSEGGDGEGSASDKPLSRQDYEARYPQTREGQLRRVQEERDAVLDAKWAELTEKGLSPAQIKQDKGYQRIVNAFNAEEAEVKENFPEAEADASGGEAKEGASKPAGISLSDDVSALKGDDKLEYDAAVNSYNRGMENLRAQLESGEISRKEFREEKANLLKTLNEDRADLGFSTPVDADGAAIASTEATTKAPSTNPTESPELSPDGTEGADDVGGDDGGGSDGGGGDGGGDDSPDNDDSDGGGGTTITPTNNPAPAQGAPASATTTEKPPKTPPAPSDTAPDKGGEPQAPNPAPQDKVAPIDGSRQEPVAEAPQETQEHDAEGDATAENVTEKPAETAAPAASSQVSATPERPKADGETAPEETGESTAQNAAQSQEGQQAQSQEGEEEKTLKPEVSPYVTAAVEKAGLSGNAASEIQNDAGIQAAMKSLADAETAFGKDSAEYKKAEQQLKSNLTRMANAIKNRDDRADTDGLGAISEANRDRVKALPKDHRNAIIQGLKDISVLDPEQKEKFARDASRYLSKNGGNITPEALEKKIKQWKRNAELMNDERRKYAAMAKAGNPISAVDADEFAASHGYRVRDEHTPKGVAAGSVKDFLGHCFDEMQYPLLSKLPTIEKPSKDSPLRDAWDRLSPEAQAIFSAKSRGANGRASLDTAFRSISEMMRGDDWEDVDSEELVDKMNKEAAAYTRWATGSEYSPSAAEGHAARKEARKHSEVQTEETQHIDFDDLEKTSNEVYSNLLGEIYDNGLWKNFTPEEMSDFQPGDEISLDPANPASVDNTFVVDHFDRKNGQLYVRASNALDDKGNFDDTLFKIDVKTGNTYIEAVPPPKGESASVSKQNAPTAEAKAESAEEPEKTGAETHGEKQGSDTEATRESAEARNGNTAGEQPETTGAGESEGEEPGKSDASGGEELSLVSETAEEQKAEKEKIVAQEKKKQDASTIQERLHAPLKGGKGDLGQGVLFGGEENLFNRDHTETAEPAKQTKGEPKEAEPANKDASAEPAKEPAPKTDGKKSAQTKTEATPKTESAPKAERPTHATLEETEQINAEIASKFASDKQYLDARQKLGELQDSTEKLEQDLEKARKGKADPSKRKALRDKLKQAKAKLKDAETTVRSMEESIENQAFGKRGFTRKGDRVPQDVLTATRIYQEGWKGSDEGAIHPVAMQQGKDLVEYIQGKNLRRLINTLSDIDGNRQSRKAFEALTGKELPKTSEGTVKFLREFCGADAAKPEAPKPPESTDKETKPKEPTATEKKTPSSTTETSAETPQMKAYRERKAAEEKAEQEKKAQQAAERAKRLEEARKNQPGRGDLNAQSRKFAEQAQASAEKSSKGIQTLASIQPPKTIDYNSTKELNRQLEEVGSEIKRLTQLLNDDTVKSPDEERAINGTIEKLRQGLKDIPQQQKLGKGNYGFAAEMDSSGHLVGLRITEFKDSEGKMQSLSSPKNADVANMDRGEKISYMSRLMEKSSLESPVRLTSTESRKMAESLLSSIDKKDKAGLMEMCRIANKPGREAFSAITGVELPNDIKGTVKAIDDFCKASSGNKGGGNNNPPPAPSGNESKQKTDSSKSSDGKAKQSDTKEEKTAAKGEPQTFGASEEQSAALQKRIEEREAQLENEDSSTLGAGLLARLKAEEAKKKGKGKKGGKRGKGGVTHDEAIAYEFPDLWAAMNEVSPLEEEEEQEDVWADVYNAALASMGVEG